MIRLRVRSLIVALALIGSLVLGGCQTTSFYISKTLQQSDTDLRFLLMPIDVELSEMSAGGVKEPNAEWTAKAEVFITEILREHMRDRGSLFAEYKKSDKDATMESELVQLQKLHGAVGNTIIVHKYLPVFELPTKEGKFDWSLGPAVRQLRDTYDADYALFVFIRDSYTSGGRAVAIILAAALFGVALEGGTQVGFASLVDLHTGDIVWFNMLARGTGDLRERQPAVETVTLLLQDFPK